MTWAVTLRESHLTRLRENDKNLTSLSILGEEAMYWRIDYSQSIRLTDALIANSTLTSLNLYGSHIEDEGAAELKRALKKNKTLRRLNLKGNGLTDAGVQSIAEGIAENTSIRTLNMGVNPFGDVGVIALKNSLVNNYTLTSVGFFLVNVDGYIKKQVNDYLRRNKQLIKLLPHSTADQRKAWHLHGERIIQYLKNPELTKQEGMAFVSRITNLADNEAKLIYDKALSICQKQEKKQHNCMFGLFHRRHEVNKTENLEPISEMRPTA